MLKKNDSERKILNFSNFLFQLYIIKAINEMDVCTVDLGCVQKSGNSELTVLNG